MDNIKLERKPELRHKYERSKVAEGFDSKFEVAEAARKELENLLSEETKEKLHGIGKIL